MKISQVLKKIFSQQNQLTRRPWRKRLKVFPALRHCSLEARYPGGNLIYPVGGDINLDTLIKRTGVWRKRSSEDSKARNGIILVHPLLAHLGLPIGVFAYFHHIFMAGFLISTLFMLFYELHLYQEKRFGCPEGRMRNIENNKKPRGLELPRFFIY